MKKALILATIALFICATFSLDVTTVVQQTAAGQGGIGSTSALYNTGIVKDWQVLAFGLAIITVFLVAMARMFAEPLNSAELKAWANTEWSQVIVTVVIVVFAIVALEFVDSLVLMEVNASPGSPVTCELTDFCVGKVSNSYLDGLITLTQESARSSFVNSIEAAKVSSSRQTFSCGLLECLWYYTAWATNAYMILDSERYNQELEQYNGILFSLGVQKFFVNNVAFMVAPALLLIGIVARAFFLTRKAGGLLMAVGMGLMFVFPMMYLWNMITLNVTVYGDKLFESGDPDCPAECGIMPSKNAPCNTTIYDSCPYFCRVLPYPYTNPDCTAPEVERACMDVPQNCKAVRTVINPKGCSSCPADCKITPPLDGTHDCDACFVSATESVPFNCRVALAKIHIARNGALTTDLTDRPDGCNQDTTNATTAINEAYHSSDYLNQYIAALRACPTNNTNAFKSCTYVAPDPPDCECQDANGDGKVVCCINVPGKGSSCGVLSQIGNAVYIGCTEGDATCLNYPGARYWNTLDSVCSCYGEECKSPSQHCNSCYEVENDYCLFNPPVVPNCEEDCPATAVKKSTTLGAAEFAKKSSESMYGREDIKNVSRLMIPAYLLPLINIVVTLMFIRGFSGLFGGDIDLPGYTKVL